MIIGITGRAGVGKSHAASIINQNFDSKLIDLDIIGHDLLHQQNIKDNLRKAFGDAIFNELGEVSRKTLGDLVFSSDKELQKLNAIMHPEIRKHCLAIIKKNNGLILVVGALLKEIDIRHHLDHIIHITATETSLAKYSSKKAHIRAIQESEVNYASLADISIQNNFTNIFSIDMMQHINTLLKDS